MSDLPEVCPRCRGPMLPLQRDLYGEFRVCLPCGYYADRLEEPPIGRQPQRIMLPVRRGRRSE